MKRKLPLLFGALFLAFAASACEGPEGPRGPAGADGPAGPEGPQGPQGPAGEDAAQTCSDCHAADATIVAIEQQFTLSPHSSETFELRGPSYAGGSCVACHTSQGFEAAATGTTADFSDGVASMNCRTCHQVHETFEGQDFALTTTDPVGLIITGNTIDLSGTDVPGSNLCINCHQGRDEDTYPQWDAPVTQIFTVPSSHYDLHYGPQANVFTQEFPAELSYGLADVGSFRFHEAASCLGCHMGFGSEVADFDMPDILPGGELHHNFRPAETLCNQCHNDPLQEGFEYQGTRAAIDAGVVALGACLAAEGVVEVDPADGHEFHVIVGDHPEPYVAAYMVLTTLEEDGSWGAHNPPFIKAWLQSTRQQMDALSANVACDYTP